MQDSKASLFYAPKTVELIELCQDVIQKARKPEELEQALVRRKESMDKARKDFLLRVKEEGDAHMQTFQEEIEDVIKAFDAYNEAFNELNRFFLEGKKNIFLQQGVELLKISADKMVKALQRYDDKELMVGPTDIPYVNFIIKVQEKLKQGIFSVEAFRNVVAVNKKRIEDSLKEAENYYARKASAEIEEVITAHKEHQRGIALLEEYLKSKDINLLDRGVEVIKEAAIKIKDSLSRFCLKKLTELPTKSPHVNLLINVANGFSDNQTSVLAFASAIDSFENHIQDVKKEFEKYCSLPTDSQLIQEEIPKVMESFNLYGEAIEDMRSFMETRDSSLLESSVDLLSKATEQIYNSYQLFMEISEKEGRIICPQCQHYNLLGVKSCERCGAVLPRLLETSTSLFQIKEGMDIEFTSQEMVMTENLKKLFDAVNDVADGNISGEEFASILNWMEGLLRQGEAKMLEVPMLEVPSLGLDTATEEEIEQAKKDKEMVDDTRALLKEGIDIFYEGLKQMRRYLEDQQKEHLIEGVRTVWQGASKIYQVQKIGEIVEKTEEQEKEAEGILFEEDTFISGN